MHSPIQSVSRARLLAGTMAALMLVALPGGAIAADERASVIPDLVPKAELPLAPAEEVNVSYAPDVPPASGRTAPAVVEVAFEVVENVTAIDPATGVEYETWGYKVAGDEGTVSGTPGPMIRARVGDVLRFTVTNPESNKMPHNVDFHAVTGQGGGAANTVVAPGMTAIIEARLLYPGMFMYHCAMGDVPEHISRGMYGGILVDPAELLPDVDHEWYVVQSEYYTTSTEPGLVETDRAAITAEQPTMVVFNGAKGAIAGDNALKMQVGERGRIYFVNAGLNLISSLHPIGSHWDTVYQEAALLNEPLRGSQTTLVPAGGGTVVELVGQVPMTVLLVDHALARTFDKGALGQIIIEGEANPEIFEAIPVE
jgi:nitrite reductase (NO-forming)